MSFPFDLVGKVSFSGEAVANLVFFLVSALVALMSIILFFHWRKYGLGGVVLAITELIYLAVSAALLATAFFNLN